MLGRTGPYRFADADGGIKVAVGATTVEIATLVKGRRYRVTVAAGGDGAGTQTGGAVFRWGADDAASSNGNFDFAIAAGESLEIVAESTTINVIEMDATSAATAAVYFSPIEHA